MQYFTSLVLSGAAYIKSLCNWQKTPLSCFHCTSRDIEPKTVTEPIIWIYSVVSANFIIYVAGRVSCKLYKIWEKTPHTCFIVAEKSHKSGNQYSEENFCILKIHHFSLKFLRNWMRLKKLEKCKPHSSLSTNHFTRAIYTIHIMNSLAVWKHHFPLFIAAL